MATMIPSFDDPVALEEYLPSDSYGNGGWWERKLYDLMRDEFPAQWTVFHHQYSHDGDYRHEYDFLVFVPGKGIVNLDAKGNGWGFQNGTWYRERDNTRTYDDPIRQAEGAVATLDKTIRSKITDGDPWGGYGYCLAFAGVINNPAMENVFVHDGARSIETGRRAWAKALATTIENVLNCSNAQRHHRFFTSKMEYRIRSFFHVPNAPKPTQDNDFRNWDAISNTALTCRQRAVSARLRDVDVLHVVGAAGTGKTVVAINLLRDSKARGEKALYVCYNRALAETLTVGNPDLRGDANIVLSNYDRLPYAKLPGFGQLNRIVGVKASDDWETYRQFIREALDRFSENNRGPFKLIVIDEAQDLHPLNIVSLYNLLSPKGKIVVLSDKGQTIFSAGWDFSPDIFGEILSDEVRLDENWRNSSIIHEHYKDYAEVYPPVAVLDDCKTPVQNVDDVKSLLRRLVIEDHRDTRDIVILSFRVDELRQLEGGVPGTTCKVLYSDPECIPKHRNDPNKIVAATVQGFKGLESPIVVLIMSDKCGISDDEWDRLRYVGESRAKYELYIVDLVGKAK